MENIYTFVEQKLDPELRRKCVYNLDIDKQGNPFILIEYKCGEQKLDIFDFAGQQNDEVENFAAELTRLTRDYDDFDSISTMIKPLVLDYEKRNLKFDYGRDIENIGPVEFSKDILLGFIVNKKTVTTLEEKILLCEHVISLAAKLHKNTNYVFAVNYTEEIQSRKHI